MNDIRFVLGRTIDTDQLVDLSEAETSTHALILGGTGSGKSRLITDLVLQHFHQGRGCAVFDPDGDTAEDVMAHLAAHVVTTGKKTWLKRVHYLEPSPFLCFKYNPGRFYYPKLIHPELMDSVEVAWREAKADRLTEILGANQGQSSFEGMPRLQRNARNQMRGKLTRINGRSIPLGDAVALVNPFHPRHKEVVSKLAPGLDDDVAADLGIFRGLKRPEDLLRLSESVTNWNRSLFTQLMKSIVDCDGEEGVNLYDIVRNGHLLLVNLRQSLFWTKSQAVALGQMLIHDLLEVGQVMPREHRRPFSIFIEEGGALLSDDLCESAPRRGRKLGMKLWFCGQNLDTYRKGEKDYVPTLVSQCGIIAALHMKWYEDAQILARVMGMGNLEFDWLIQEVERHGGYEWRQVMEYGLSLNRSTSWSESDADGLSDSEGVQDGEADSKQQARGTSKAVALGASTATNDGRTTGTSDGRRESPIMIDGRVNKMLQLGAEQDSTSDNHGVTRADSITNTETEQESTSLGKTISRMLSKARALSKTHTRTHGGGEGEGLSISQKWVILNKVIREEQLTGALKKSVSDQLEQLAQLIATQVMREAFLKLPGQKKAFQIKTREVKDPFATPESLVKAVEWMKRELNEVHEYHFVPNLKELSRGLHEFLAQDQEVVPHVVLEESPLA